MSVTLRAAMFGAFLSFGGTAVAAGDAGVPNVTVTAPRPPTAQELAGQAVPNFVRSHSTPSRVTGQLTRWRTPVCPWAKGLDDDMDNYVTARIRAIAAAVGAPHDDSPKCKANVLILFVLEPEKQAQSLLKSESASLGFHYPSEAKTFTVFNHPIQGWYVTSTRNWKGLELVDDPQAFGLFGQGKQELNGQPSGDPSSRLDNYLSSQVVSATIIADRNKITGMTIGSISDYIAVLTLTQARMSEGCSQLPSIMDLMSPGCPGDKSPDQVTAGDLAYLGALYSADLETPVAIERSNIEAVMLRAFAVRR